MPVIKARCYALYRLHYTILTIISLVDVFFNVRQDSIRLLQGERNGVSASPRRYSTTPPTKTKMKQHGHRHHRTCLPRHEIIPPPLLEIKRSFPFLSLIYLNSSAFSFLIGIALRNIENMLRRGSRFFRTFLRVV